MDNISLRGSNENMWPQAYLTQGYNESFSQFAIRVDSVNQYQGPPKSILRRDSHPRDNYYSVSGNISGVSGRNEVNAVQVESGSRRGSYHIHLAVGPTGKMNPQNNERREMPFVETHSPGQSAPATNKKPGFLRTLWVFISCLIPCMADRKTKH